MSAKSRESIDGLVRLHELGLEHMELEFVHGVRMSEEKAELIGRKAKELGITLTVHAPYYINLNSPEPDKRRASIGRIVDSCRVGRLAGAKSVCFHAAFNLNQQAEQVFDRVLTEMMQIEEILSQEDINEIRLAPEVTGKPTQFGDVDELLALAKELKQTKICIDFAHYFARSAGVYNSYEEFLELIRKVQKELGEESLEELHIHYSGIEYSGKGERNHLELLESEFNWKKMLKALKYMNVGGYMVCESPNLEKDALLAQEYYQQLK